MRSRWPSFGFIAGLLVYGAAVIFFGWGLQEPELDRIWRLHQELRSGQRVFLDPADRQSFAKAFSRHPSIADRILNGGRIGLVSANSQGWLRGPGAVIVRTPASGNLRIVHLDVEVPPGMLPVELSMRGDGWARSAVVTNAGPVDMALPAPSGTPEIISVDVRTAIPLEVGGVPGIRIGFPGN